MLNLYTGSRQNKPDKIKFLTLRQQLKKREGVPSFALADFIAPKETRDSKIIWVVFVCQQVLELRN